MLRDMPQFTVNTPVEINAMPTCFTVIKKTNPTNALPFSEADLLQDMTEHHAHTDCLTAPLSTEWVHQLITDHKSSY